MDSQRPRRAAAASLGWLAVLHGRLGFPAAGGSSWGLRATAADHVAGLHPVSPPHVSGGRRGRAGSTPALPRRANVCLSAVYMRPGGLGTWIAGLLPPLVALIAVDFRLVKSRA
ncbi:hypothetical protein PLESTM_002024700 [Pleodorina starrii]|nr:hypothetical protein PLESTM_002024700 [Pleodorina starrii]